MIARFPIAISCEVPRFLFHPHKACALRRDTSCAQLHRSYERFPTLTCEKRGSVYVFLSSVVVKSVNRKVNVLAVRLAATVRDRSKLSVWILRAVRISGRSSQSRKTSHSRANKPKPHIPAGLPKCEQRDMMWPWMSEISTRSGPNRSLWNTHVHDANEAISTRSAGCDGRRKIACHRVQTSATAHFTPNYEITSSGWMMT